MNGKAPDTFKNEADVATAEAIDALWDQLGDALPEPPSGRLRRGVRRTIWMERLRDLGTGLPLAGMATALVVGLVLGRVLFIPDPATVPDAKDYRLETRVLSGSALSARLEAIVSLREAEALPPDAAAALARVVGSPDSSAGLQLAALEALVAHSRQDEVRLLLTGLLDQAQDNVMVEARLQEISGQSTPPPDRSET